MSVYIGLFVASFMAATLLPGGSEALLVYDLAKGYAPFWLWMAATAGNTLGSVLNYWLGRKGEAYLESKGYLSKDAMQSAHRRFRKWGGWALLLSWVPFIGDPITFIAGMLRYELKKFVLIVAFAKGVRYAIVIATYLVS